MTQFDAEEREGKLRFFEKADSVEVFEGEIGCVDADGAIAAATAAEGLKALGRIERVDGKDVRIKKGCFCYQNSAADALSRADIGADCFIENSTTVCKTADAKSKAGVVFDVDDSGVWVEF